jgi:hypothetical protein
MSLSDSPYVIRSLTRQPFFFLFSFAFILGFLVFSYYLMIHMEGPMNHASSGVPRSQNAQNSQPFLTGKFANLLQE